MEPVIRYTPPTKYDIADYGTLYKDLHDENLVEYYIQLSKDSADPNWVKVGFFLEKVFGEVVTHDNFIKACLDIYNKNENSFFKFIDILKELKTQN